MTSRQHKIEKKRCKREKRRAKKQAHECRRAAWQMFPEVFYENEGASPAFFDAVQRAMREIARDYPRLMDKRSTRLMRAAKEVGFPYILHGLAQAENRSLRESLQVARFACLLGELVMGRLQNATSDLFFPCQDFDVIPGRPRANTILVRCRALRDVNTRGGTAYFSPWEPSVRLDGKDWIVAFSRHAIERICDRAVGDWKSYAGWGDVFGFLHNCLYFEPLRLSKRDVGFSLFQECRRPCFSYYYAEQILGRLNPKNTYYYRVGYCPVVYHGVFVTAKTLLTPGMRGTPEHAVLCRMASDFEQRLNLERQIKRHALCDLVESEDFSLIKKFHVSGSPQVVSFDHEVFRTRSINRTASV